MIQPNTTIYLCDTPLHKDNKNQFTFTNATKQNEYFLSTVKFTYLNSVYVRKDQPINVNYNIETIRTCNYLFYQNSAYTNKIFYAFIDRMEYVNDNTTSIYITTDVFQTYYFDIQYNTCFVEREHVNDDTVGLHTINEELESGEYIIDNEINVSQFASYYIMVNTSSVPSGYTNYFSTNIGNYSVAGNMFVCQDNTGLYNLCTLFSTGMTEAVNNVWLVPRVLVGGITFGDNKFVQWQGQSLYWHDETEEHDKPTSLNGYTPKNNKLLCYPYTYLVMNNNNGSSNILHFELFDGDKFGFNYIGLPSLGGSIMAYPRNYKEQNISTLDGLSLGKYPTLSWSEDSYTNWLTQNALNLTSGIAGGIINIVGGATAFGISASNPASEEISGLSSISSGIKDIMNIMSQKYQHELVPQTSKGNTNEGDILTASGLNTPIYTTMCIKEEYAKIIDQFLSAYGYKVSTWKVPNITGRRNWNYVKTIEANMTGNIPDDDIDIIRAMFNNGVTLWHNPANIFNYSLNNDII